MNATLIERDLASTEAPSAIDPRAVVGTPRFILKMEGAAALASACLGYSALGGQWSVFALLFLVPDLSMAGFLAGARVGAACYNAMHSYVGPALLAAVGAIVGVHGALLVACIWAAHIGFDRALGYGLKYGTAFGDTHLGLAKRKPR